jgi:two-component system chemotaxis response regulator CheY
MSDDGVILVVDDDDAIREFVRDALEFDGYNVATARDGQDALDALAHLEPALVLLDMRMPVLDGWGFSQQYRARGGRAPLVVMTAAENAEGWRAEVGGEACLPKPFMLDDLFDVVARYCTRSAKPGDCVLTGAA